MTNECDELVKVKELLRKLYDSASALDLEYCNLLHQYGDKMKGYKIPEEYDDVWMEDFIKVEEYLGIE